MKARRTRPAPSWWCLAYLRGCVVALLLLVWPGAAMAIEYEGAEFPEMISAGDTTLRLAGCGVREAFIFDVYVAALYLPRVGMGADEIIARETSKAVELRIVFNGSIPDDIPESWSEPLDRIPREDIQRTIADIYADFSTGDRMTIRHTPALGTEVRINDMVRKHSEGSAIIDPLQQLWIGEAAVSGNLRRLLLGGSCGDLTLPVRRNDGG